MSLNHISGHLPDLNIWANPHFNSISIVDGMNFNNSGITNLSSINGEPVPPFTIDVNSFNIIYQPGGSIPPSSNIVNTWAQVCTKASQANVNQIINIYFDDSKVSPCPINASYNFNGRGVFKSVNSSTTDVKVQINDTFTITNLARIEGPGLQVLCESKTTQSLAFTTGSKLIISNNATLSVTADSTIPACVFNDTKFNISLRHASNLDNSLNTGNTVFEVINAGTLTVTMEESSNTSSNTISSDVASAVNISYDAFISGTITQSAVLGTLTITASELSKNVSYSDTVTPTFASTNVQGVFDSLKNNGLSTNGSIDTAGDVVFGNRLKQSVGLGGAVKMQMYTDNSGDIFWYNGSSASNQIAFITPTDYDMYTNLDMQNTTKINANLINSSTLTASQLVVTDSSKNLVSTNTLSSAVLGNITKITTTIFNGGASGNYTPPTGVTHIRVRVWGDSGGSGGCAATAAVSGGAAGSGGGAYTESFYSAPFTPFAYAVGTGGLAGSSSAGNGTAGAGTTFGSMSSGPGAPGNGYTASAVLFIGVTSAGGTATGGNVLNLNGMPSLPPITINTAINGAATSGAGGNSPQGGQGGIGKHVSSAGIQGGLPGAGSSGAVCTNGGSSAAGANGQAGLIICEEYYNG